MPYHHLHCLIFWLRLRFNLVYAITMDAVNFASSTFELKIHEASSYEILSIRICIRFQSNKRFILCKDTSSKSWKQILAMTIMEHIFFQFRLHNFYLPVLKYIAKCVLNTYNKHLLIQTQWIKNTLAEKWSNLTQILWNRTVMQAEQQNYGSWMDLLKSRPHLYPTKLLP